MRCPTQIASDATREEVGMARSTEAPDTRSPERLRFHYEVERELSDRLRTASAAERTTLYGELYNELFARVTDHPQLVRKASEQQRTAGAFAQVALLEQWLTPDMHVLEIGAGDCAVTRVLSARVRKVTAVDVSDAIASGTLPDNVDLRITDGRTLPVENGTVDLAYSNQLLEHLHPDDAGLHAREVRRVLRDGGRYVCLTPHRFAGPSDISKHFDEEATGFHLKEYTLGDLQVLFKSAGFRRVDVLARAKALNFLMPVTPLVAAERLLERQPPARRRRVAGFIVVRNLLGFVVAHA
jgi:SAM-dependent methyltransferase